MKKIIVLLIASFAIIALPGTTQTKIEKKPGIERRDIQTSPQLAVVIDCVELGVVQTVLGPSGVFHLQQIKVQDHSDIIFPIFQEVIKPQRNEYIKNFTVYSNKLAEKKFIRNPHPPLRVRI